VTAQAAELERAAAAVDGRIPDPFGPGGDAPARALRQHDCRFIGRIVMGLLRREIDHQLAS